MIRIWHGKLGQHCCPSWGRPTFSAGLSHSPHRTGREAGHRAFAGLHNPSGRAPQLSAIAKRPPMTSGALEAVTPIGVAGANDAPRRTPCRRCGRVRREDDMSAARQRATGVGQGTTQRQLRLRLGNTAGPPAANGLYDPALEKDPWGVGFIADFKGRRSHKLIEDALAILCNLEHRGAVGADPRAGDGAGILVQIPHKFFVKKADRLGFRLPKTGEYAVGALFMPRDP